MKQKHINNAVVYLGRIVFFVLLFCFLIFVSNAISLEWSFYYFVIAPALVFIIFVSIGWTLVLFIEQLGKAVSK